MRIKVTRSFSDEQVYAVSAGYGMGTRPGVSAEELRTWLAKLGLEPLMIEKVLSISPNESITLEVADSDEQERPWAKAS